MEDPLPVGSGVAVVVPCYRVKQHILEVLNAIPAIVQRIYCVDDGCPDSSGEFVRQNCHDTRVEVLNHDRNSGVGAAMVSGYRAALADGMKIVVKIDGDGQMDPALLPRFVKLIEIGEADYCKGNRFYSGSGLRGMPPTRLAGNAFLSFVTKLSSGYWQIFDPNNGYTAIHATTLRLIPLDDVDKGYFFESDMLFRLNILRAVVRDIPMASVYKDETSNLKIHRVAGIFVVKHAKNLFKRIIYNYYIRDFNLASIEAPIGIAAIVFGSAFGAIHWLHSYYDEQFASAGTVMLSALPILVGLQLLLSAFNYDIQNVPQTPLQHLLDDDGDGEAGS